MTRHINIFLILFASSFIFSCKEKDSTKKDNHLSFIEKDVDNKQVNINSDYIIWYPLEKK